eukprot:10851179-Karenia_brevis.AAC.1
MVPLSVRAKDRHGAREILHPVVLPTDWLYYLSQSKTVMDKVLLGEPGQLEKYWEYEKSRPGSMRHPFMDLPEEEHAWGIPYALHGDDIGVHRSDKVLVLQLHSILPENDIALGHLPITLLPYQWLLEGVTLRQLYQIVTDNANCAYQGQFPLKDPLGEEFNINSW